MINKLFYRFAKNTEKKYIPKADGAFVVSYALKDYIIKEYGVKYLPFYIIPCAISQTKINLHEKLFYRKQFRELYNVNDSDVLFIYSGGISPWQCVSESVDLFCRIKQKIQDPHMKMLILSRNCETLKHLKSESIMVDSFASNMVDKVQCAGDFAFMLRDDCVTNNVAFPNKFLEYVASGMKIVASPFIFDIKIQLDEFKLGVIINHKQEDIQELLNYIRESYNYGNDFDLRQELLDRLCFEKTLSPFIAALRGGE